MQRVTLLAVCCLTLPIVATSSYIYLQDRSARTIKAEMCAEEVRIEARIISNAMRRYTEEQGKPPQSLNDLVIAGYLKAIPGLGPIYYDPPMHLAVSRPNAPRKL